jgi:hypothetical protein
MDDVLLAAFGVVINTRCEAIMRAVRRLHDANNPDSDAEDCWDAIFAILNHAGALSRLFWPPKLPRNPAKDTPAQRARRQRHLELRAWFKVADDSRLNVSGRDLRNGIEHWDEDVEEWLADKVGQQMYDSIVTSGQVRQDALFIRTFSYRTWTVTYGDQSLALRPLLAEVGRVHERFGEVRPELRLPTHANPILGG